MLEESKFATLFPRYFSNTSGTIGTFGTFGTFGGFNRVNVIAQSVALCLRPNLGHGSQICGTAAEYCVR